jgi:hypothetical protein
MAFDTIGSNFSLLLSILFAYLATAFFVGNRLTGFQSMVVSFLFIFAATIMVAATYGSMQRALSFVDHLRQLHPEEFFMMSAPFANALLVLMSLSIPVSLYFLYKSAGTQGSEQHRNSHGLNYRGCESWWVAPPDPE